MSVSRMRLELVNELNARKYFTHFLMFLIDAHQNAHFFHEIAHQMPSFFCKNARFLTK
jgi:hypothetical protein